MTQFERKDSQAYSNYLSYIHLHLGYLNLIHLDDVSNLSSNYVLTLFCQMKPVNFVHILGVKKMSFLITF